MNELGWFLIADLLGCLLIALLLTALTGTPRRHKMSPENTHLSPYAIRRV